MENLNGSRNYLNHLYNSYTIGVIIAYPDLVKNYHTNMKQINDCFTEINNLISRLYKEFMDFQNSRDKLIKIIKRYDHVKFNSMSREHNVNLLMVKMEIEIIDKFENTNINKLHQVC
jgi:hypothetical protein